MSSSLCALLGFFVCASAAASFGCDRWGKGAVPQGAADVWLSRIGSGPAQTARACARGATDRIATALCKKQAPSIGGLGDLYRVLRLDQPAERLTATAVHSLGLSARTVSGLNPRVLVYQDISHKRRPVTYEEVVVVGFTRGEQLVELAALDPATYEYNFYLLSFSQACNRTRCTPEDLLTEKIESGWTAWTLYTDHDLVDTALDCVSCHLPFGPGTHKQLLMRQVVDPWMHWGDFRGGDERTVCPEPPADGSAGKVVVVAEGLDLLRAVEGPQGRYAGVPVAELHAAKSGELFVRFVADAEGLIRRSPYRPADYPSYEPFGFLTREVLCERFRTGTSPTWDQQRRQALDRGVPVPYYRPDVVDAQRRAEVAADRTAFLRRHADKVSFDVAASFIAAEAAGAVGFVPRPEDSAPAILRSMCVRCHAAGVDQHLRRARFNAESIDTIDPVTATMIRRRLSLPPSSPELMPPLRVGELPSWAIARIERYLRDRCVDPGACS
jgi:hypothetical protein